jgi:hypothetical protein
MFHVPKRQFQHSETRQTLPGDAEERVRLSKESIHILEPMCAEVAHKYVACVCDRLGADQEVAPNKRVICISHFTFSQNKHQKYDHSVRPCSNRVIICNGVTRFNEVVWFYTHFAFGPPPSARPMAWF